MAWIELLSHSHSAHTHVTIPLYVPLQTKVCPSYIYTYVTFWLFTFVVLMGLTLRLFTNIASRIGYVHNSGFGLRRIPHQLGSCLRLSAFRTIGSSSYGRDIFPTDWAHWIITNYLFCSIMGDNCCWYDLKCMMNCFIGSSSLMFS